MAQQNQLQNQQLAVLEKSDLAWGIRSSSAAALGGLLPAREGSWGCRGVERSLLSPLRELAWRQCPGVTQAEEGRGSWGVFSLTLLCPWPCMVRSSVCAGWGLSCKSLSQLHCCPVASGRGCWSRACRLLCAGTRYPSVSLSKTSELSRIQYQRERPAAAEECRMVPSQLPWNCRSFTLLQEVLKLAVFWALFLISLRSA